MDSSDVDVFSVTTSVVSIYHCCVSITPTSLKNNGTKYSCLSLFVHWQQLANMGECINYKLRNHGMCDMLMMQHYPKQPPIRRRVFKSILPCVCCAFSNLKPTLKHSYKATSTVALNWNRCLCCYRVEISSSIPFQLVQQGQSDMFYFLIWSRISTLLA